MEQDTPPPKGAGLPHDSTMLSLLKVRLELFEAEAGEEASRVRRWVLFSLLAILSANLAAVSVCVLLVLLTPAPYRAMTLAAICVLCIGLCVTMVHRSRALWSGSARMFPLTRREVAADWDAIYSKSRR